MIMSWSVMKNSHTVGRLGKHLHIILSTVLFLQIFDCLNYFNFLSSIYLVSISIYQTGPPYTEWYSCHEIKVQNK